MSERLTNNELDKLLSKRVHIDYDDKDQIIINNEKIIFLLQIDNQNARGNNLIYDNQEICALQIVARLHDKKIINVMVLGLTQSGKTGAMLSLIKNYVKHNLIPIENIYIITGLSSCEWMEQTKNRCPESIKDRVFHRDNLTNKFIKDIKEKKNVLVIMDEIQIAAKENQTMRNAFKEAGFYDKQKLLKNDIKIVEFTATPDGNVYDVINWGDNACKIKMEPGEGYTNCFDLYKEGRVFQCKDLCGYNNRTKTIYMELIKDNINEIKSCIQEKYNNEPLYHFIRTPNGGMGNIVINNFLQVLGTDIKYYKYDQENDIKDINTILKENPEEDTFIFIKEKLRCSKTLYKKYLGIGYERFTNSPDDSVIIQGIIGRGTGYDDNKKSIYFTNIPSIIKYETLWKSNFEDKTVKWISKTTKYENDILHSKGTYNNPSLIDGMDVSSNEDAEKEHYTYKPTIVKMPTLEKIKCWFHDNLKPNGYGNGPHLKKPDVDGFYKCMTQRDKNYKIRSIKELTEIEMTNNWGFRGNTDKSREKNKYRVYPCYADITNNQSSLEWWLVYY